MIALQTPGFTEHLPPFCAGDHRHADPAQIDPAALPGGFVASFGIGWFPGFQHPQALPRSVDQLRGVI